ncbi:MAG: sigma-E factor negative regulatory protein RseB [Gammaproteobacteria bacterium]|nr:MAG: sigma-E factor negative regulatory protein RseB [Gammaproteobacteria bacterium]TND06927.1 MAG: sigma-E factor negative regulatory protein RseB [Gammaproteobacteria bacterium]
MFRAPIVRVPLLLALLSMLLAVSNVSAADGDDAPGTWLEKMTRAGQWLSYSGTFVYRRNDQMVAVNILHVADERGGRQKLEALNGESHEIVRSCDGAICFLPRQKSVVINKAKGGRASDTDIGERIEELQDYYRFTLVGDDRIAGRPTQAMIIEPVDQYRFGYRIWIDKETGLLLKSDMINDAGATIEQIMFTNLEIITTPTEDMVHAVDQKTAAGARLTVGQEVIYSDEETSDKSEYWRVENVPDGFKPVDHYRHRRSVHGGQTEHMIFTDGLASVSVFIEKTGDADNLLSGFSAIGAVNAFGTTVDDYHVTVVGEVPTLTVRLIGESVRYRPGVPRQ